MQIRAHANQTDIIRAHTKNIRRNDHQNCKSTQLFKYNLITPSHHQGRILVINP